MAELDYRGYFCFEREAGAARGADVAAGRDYLTNLLLTKS